MRRLEPGWYAAQVRAQSEKMVAALLKYKGYEPFLPTYPKFPARRNSEPQPLFPGYVFCHVGESAAGLIVTTPGVIQLLGVGNMPQAVPDFEIDNLKRLLATGLRVAPWQHHEVGMRARFVDGPLKGCTGVIVNTDSDTHLVVSVELLRRSVSVRINREWVEAISPTPKPMGVGIQASERVHAAPAFAFGARGAR